MSDPGVAAATASAAWTTASAPAAIPFRSDADGSFPLGGAVLLVVLIVAAAWAWWYGRARGVSRAPAWASWLRARPAPSGDLKVLDTLQPSPGVTLMVVEWSGGRVLVGINGAAAPTTLDRTGSPNAGVAP